MATSAQRPADTFETERLRLRRFSDDDIEFALAVNSNPDLVRFIPSSACSTLDDASRWLARIQGNTAPGRGWWCAEADGIPVAALLLKRIPASAGRTSDDVEIGWRAPAAHTGKGYVTEAASALLSQAHAGGLPRVVAVTDPENVASQRVAERIGMTRVGLTNDYYDETEVLFVSCPPDRPSGLIGKL